MSENRIGIKNVSSTTPITVSFVPSTSESPTAEVPTTIPPHQLSAVDPGTAAGIVLMSVSMAPYDSQSVDSRVVWKGMVPTRCSKPILVDPDNIRVIYENMLLPAYSGIEKFTLPASQKKTNWYIWGIVILLILLAIYVYKYVY